MKIPNLLSKIAITFEDYKNLHPKTRKKPNDPMFTKPKKPSALPVESNKKKPRSKDPTEAFRPKLVKSPLQRSMRAEEFHRHAQKMTSDDVAWHLMNGEVAAKDTDELRKVAYKHMGVAEYYALTLLNPKVSKSEKDDAAAYILDKAGVSFVASKKIRDFIFDCAKKGVISKDIVEEERKSEKERETQNAIADLSSNQIVKLSKSKIKENWREVCRNTSAPPNFLQGLLKEPEVKNGIESIKQGYIEDSGYMVNVAKRKDAIGKALTLLQNPNLPFKEIRFLEKSMDDFLSNKNAKAVKPALILANHPDINKPENRELRDKVLKVFQTRLFYGVPDKESKEETFVSKSRSSASGVAPPSTFVLTEKEFLSIHANFSKEDDFEKIYEHPACPDSLLKKALLTRSKHWRNKYTKPKVFDELMKRKALSEKEIIATVKKNLGLEGDPEILKRFAKQAYIAGKQKVEKKTITRASEEEKNRVKAEMAKTVRHEEFDFEVLDVYEVSQDANNKFEETAKRIGNVMNLYHGTSFSGAGGIISTGVQIGGENRTGAMFGQGFYLASDSSKAAQYAGENFSQNEGEGVVLMLQTALGKSKTMKFGLPPSDELKYRQLSPEEIKMKKEYEKRTGKKLENLWHFDHDSVSAQAGPALMYDEYVVKDAAQVQVQKIVVIRKTPRIKK